MIPLVRPQIPNPAQWVSYWRESEMANQYTNFGPCFERAVKLLNWKSGGRKCLPVSNGTVAITLALQQLGIGKDSIVAVPEFTVPATMNAVLSSGAKPIVCRSSTSDWAIDLSSVPTTVDAIIVVAPFGLYVDTAKYDAWADEHGVRIVYDFAGAWGQFPETIWPITYSFHATKNFSIGEGGCISFATQDDWEYARELSNFGWLPNKQLCSDNGTNAKVDEVHCAMIVATLSQGIDVISERIQQKHKLFKYYAVELFGQVEFTGIERAAMSLCVFNFKGQGEALEGYLNHRGIMAKRYYYPLISQFDAFRDYLRNIPTCYFNDCIALPSMVSDVERDQVIKAIKSFWRTM